jgi:CTP:molybdopterin cytidylyltransferase MocA
VTLHEPHQAGKPEGRAKRLSVHALVLAAGRGSRFGGRKLQAHYRDQPLLAYPLALVAAARKRGLLDGGHAVIAVDDDASYRMVRDMKLEPVLNSAPDRGLSYSLQLGLTALEETGAPAAALILLGDQPLVRLGVVEALISAWHAGSGAIVRPRYEASPQVPGHPALVPRSVWPLIGELKGDAGFAVVGSRVGEALVHVTGHNPDVDTLSDLQGLELLQQ